VLIGLSPLLGPDLLHALASMGHGDEIGIVDANFPAASMARRLVRVDGADAPSVLSAVLTVCPLDSFVEAPAACMSVVGDDKAVPDVAVEFRKALDAAAGQPVRIEALSRQAFYQRAQSAFAVVITGERRLYGNILLRKGVIG
jgi:L-fucose mutarotase